MGLIVGFSTPVFGLIDEVFKYFRRVDELSTALQVIEKLRDYRPKVQGQTHFRNRSTGWRTPLWGTTPIIEKDHYDWSGTGTSGKEKGKQHSRETTVVDTWGQGHSKETTVVGKSWDDGAEADTEGEGTSNRPSRKNTLSKNTLEREYDMKVLSIVTFLLSFPAHRLPLVG